MPRKKKEIPEDNKDLAPEGPETEETSDFIATPDELKFVPLKGKQPDDPLLLARRLVENQIKSFIAGASTQLVYEYLRLGHHMRQKYEEIARMEGFSDVSEFVDHAVEFYLLWRDKLPQVLDELEKLKIENLLYARLLSREAKEFIKTALYRQLMFLSLAFNANPKLVETWTQLISTLLNDEFGTSDRKRNFEDSEYAWDESRRSPQSFSDTHEFKSKKGPETPGDESGG